MTKGLATILMFFAAFGATGRAEADQASHFGLNPRSMGLAGAYTAVSDDLSSLYYNPAGLVQLSGISVSTGLLLGFPLLGEDGRRLDMPDETSFYLHVGVPLSGALKDHLALGVSLNMPWGKNLAGKLYKKDEPYFAQYTAAVQLMQFRAGLSFRIPYKPLEFLSFGGSVLVLASVSGAVGLYVPLQSSGSDPDSRMEAWIDLDVPTRVFFTAGIMARLGESWRVGLTYRSEQSVEMILPVTLTARIAVSDSMRVTIPVQGQMQFKPKYYPQQVSLGGSFRRGRWMLSADLTWVDTSSYVIPYGTVVLNVEKMKKDPGLQILIGDGGEILNPYVPKLTWTDTLLPRVGAEFDVLPWLTARMGYAFEYSPLRSTDIPIYDCDKHTLAAGLRASLLRPLDLVPGQLNLDLTVQETWYVGRSILGSDVGGHVLAVSFGAEVVFM